MYICGRVVFKEVALCQVLRGKNKSVEQRQVSCYKKDIWFFQMKKDGDVEVLGLFLILFS